MEFSLVFLSPLHGVCRQFITNLFFCMNTSSQHLHNSFLLELSLIICFFFCICFLWIQMIEGVQPFHPKPPEEAIKMICLEGKRPPFKSKSRSYPPDLKE